jgi:hypothetical protein
MRLGLSTPVNVFENHTFIARGNTEAAGTAALRVAYGDTLPGNLPLLREAVEGQIVGRFLFLAAAGGPEICSFYMVRA